MRTWMVCVVFENSLGENVFECEYVVPFYAFGYNGFVWNMHFLNLVSLALIFAGI